MKKIIFLFAILMVTGMAAEDALRIQNQQTIPAAVQAGDKSVVLQMDLFHAGKITYDEVSIKLTFPQEFTPIKDTYTVGRILPGQTVTVNFRFDVSSDADPGIYTASVGIAYTETSGPYETFSSRDIYLPISSTPTLRFDDITFSPEPYVGEEFNLIFALNNTGALPASNIIANISVASGAHVTWIPDYQTVDFISSYSLGNITFKGIVSSEAAPGAYAGAVTLTYSGKMLTNTFVLEVNGRPDLRLAGSQTDDTVYTGELFTLSVQFEDVGYDRARSVKATLLDETITGNLVSYVGTIEPDDTGSAIYDITINSAGKHLVPVRVEYIDDVGNTYVLTEEIVIYAYQRPFDFSGLIILFILAGVGWYWYSSKKKKRHIAKMVD